MRIEGTMPAKGERKRLRGSTPLVLGQRLGMAIAAALSLTYQPQTLRLILKGLLEEIGAQWCDLEGKK